MSRMRDVSSRTHLHTTGVHTALATSICSARVRRWHELKVHPDSGVNRSTGLSLEQFGDGQMKEFGINHVHLGKVLDQGCTNSSLSSV